MTIPCMRDETMDGVISLIVLNHETTKEKERHEKR